jgi:hypothetical protein
LIEDIEWALDHPEGRPPIPSNWIAAASGRDVKVFVAGEEAVPRGNVWAVFDDEVDAYLTLGFLTFEEDVEGERAYVFTDKFRRWLTSAMMTRGLL